MSESPIIVPMAAKKRDRRLAMTRPSGFLLGFIFVLLGGVFGMHGMDSHAIAAHASGGSFAHAAPSIASSDLVGLVHEASVGPVESGGRDGVAGACMGLLLGGILFARGGKCRVGRHVVLGLRRHSFRPLHVGAGCLPDPPRLVALSICRC